MEIKHTNIENKIIDNNDRKLFKEKIQKIINNHSTFKINSEINFLSIAIHGKWGSGKTTFVKELKNDNLIYFNAWKYDFSDNPFFSLVEKIYSSYELKKDVTILEKFFAFSKNIELNLYLKYNNYEFGLKIRNKHSNSKNEKEKNDFLNLNKSIKDFQESLTNLLGEESLLIIIDELDRCKPSFAIDLIEIIKHLFNIKNIIIIFSVNWDQLHCSLNSKYGFIKENDGNKEYYLDKIVDWTFPIPKIDNKHYFKNLVLDNLKNDNIDSEIIENFATWANGISFNSKNENDEMSLRRVFNFFSKWYLNWRTRKLSCPKKNNFYLDFEKFFFYLSNRGLMSLDFLDKKIFSEELNIFKKILSFIDSLGELKVNNSITEIYRTSEFLFRKISIVQNLFIIVEKIVLTIDNDYDILKLKDYKKNFQKGFFLKMKEFNLNSDTTSHNYYITNGFSTYTEENNYYITDVKEGYEKYITQIDSFVKEISFLWEIICDWFSSNL